jgi:hypothetical protein
VREAVTGPAPDKKKKMMMMMMMMMMTITVESAGIKFRSAEFLAYSYTPINRTIFTGCPK